MELNSLDYCPECSRQVHNEQCKLWWGWLWGWWWQWSRGWWGWRSFRAYISIPIVFAECLTWPLLLTITVFPLRLMMILQSWPLLLRFPLFLLIRLMITKMTKMTKVIKEMTKMIMEMQRWSSKSNKKKVGHCNFRGIPRVGRYLKKSDQHWDRQTLITNNFWW